MLPCYRGFSLSILGMFIDALVVVNTFNIFVGGFAGLGITVLPDHYSGSARFLLSVPGFSLGIIYRS